MRRSVSSCVINVCAVGKWAGDTETLQAKLSDVPTIFFSLCRVSVGGSLKV